MAVGGFRAPALDAERYLARFALRSPVKSHSAEWAARTAIAVSPGLRPSTSLRPAPSNVEGRSICLPVTWVGSVEREARETPLRRPAR